MTPFPPRDLIPGTIAFVLNGNGVCGCVFRKHTSIFTRVQGTEFWPLAALLIDLRPLCVALF